MKWVLFTGTWRLANKQVEEDVRKAACEVIGRGDGIVTGGATGVDYFAMDESLRIAPDGSRLKVIIPAHLEDYIVDYYANWLHEPLQKNDIDKMAAILRRFKEVNPEHFIELPYKTITQEHYDLRSEEEAKYCDEVYAFHANNTLGTQHTIDHAVKMGLQITLHKKYSITDNRS